MTHEPFAKKRTAEAILSVVVVYDVLPFEFCDGLFNGRSAKDMRRVKECAGENLLPAAFGDGTENAGLLSGKLLDCKCEVVVFPGENDSKSLLDVGFFEWGQFSFFKDWGCFSSLSYGEIRELPEAEEAGERVFCQQPLPLQQGIRRQRGAVPRGKVCS